MYGSLKCPKRHLKDIFLHVSPMLENLEMPQNRSYSFSVLFFKINSNKIPQSEKYLMLTSTLKIDHVLFFSKCATFLCSKILKCPIFPFSKSDGKIGHFKIFEHKKVAHFEKKTRDQFWRVLDRITYFSLCGILFEFILIRPTGSDPVPLNGKRT